MTFNRHGGGGAASIVSDADVAILADSQGGAGADPAKEIQHVTGRTALKLLLSALLATPLARYARQPLLMHPRPDAGAAVFRPSRAGKSCTISSIWRRYLNDPRSVVGRDAIAAAVALLACRFKKFRHG